MFCSSAFTFINGHFLSQPFLSQPFFSLSQIRRILMRGKRTIRLPSILHGEESIAHELNTKCMRSC
jgi:hypothetical protein